MLQGGDVVWFGPDYKQTQAVWREEIKPRFAGLPGVTVSESERRVTIDGLPGSLQVLSAENIDAARGRRLDGAIFDEAGYFDLDYAWNAVVRPALVDREGWALFISTTNAGLDGNSAKRVPSYFNMLCERAERGELGADWAHFHTRTRDNTRLPVAEVEALYADYPPGSVTAAQELDAELGVAGGRYYTVDKAVHLIPSPVPDDEQPTQLLPGKVPHWWEVWGAFDWGYAHWAVFGLFARDGDGVTYLLDSWWGRKQQDEDMAKAVGDMLDEWRVRHRVDSIYAGHDCWAKITARGASGVTTAEVFLAAGILLRKADIDKANGGKALRRALAVDGQGRTRLYFVDDPKGQNRRVFHQVADIVPDPNDINKPCKVDADADGKGGDDGADMLRYAIATRIGASTEPVKTYPHVEWVADQDSATWAPGWDNPDQTIGPLPAGF